MLALKAVRRFRLGEVMELRVGAGAARVRVAGASYDSAAVPIEKTTGGITVSVSLARNLGSRLSLVLGMEDWPYQLDEVRMVPTLVPSGLEPVRQHDLVISLGLAARL